MKLSFESYEEIRRLPKNYSAKKVGGIYKVHPTVIHKIRTIQKAPDFVGFQLWNEHFLNVDAAYALARLANLDAVHARRVLDVYHPDLDGHFRLYAEKALRNYKKLSHKECPVANLPKNKSSTEVADLVRSKLTKPKGIVLTPKSQVFVDKMALECSRELKRKLDVSEIVNNIIEFYAEDV